MVPAGKGTEAVIAELAPRLHSEDIIVDGGNAFYKDSVRRAVELASYGIRFIDCGVSGGVWGLENGYALMFGGSPGRARNRAAGEDPRAGARSRLVALRSQRLRPFRQDDS
jgi:6-phosphogluconate dehydrogenase